MSNELLRGAIDNHIHCCPHINKRSTNILEVVRHAEKNKMHAIGLMDNFSNTSGYASLVKKFFLNEIKSFWRINYGTSFRWSNLKMLKLP